MTWFRVDDGFSEHAKVDALGADQPLAVCAWTLCGVTCSRKMTDGFVSIADMSRTLHTWSPKDRIRAADALVRVGLWTEVEGGWLYHDWLDRNPSRDETMAKRAAVTERQRRARGGASRVTAEPVTPSVTQSVTRDKSVSHALPSRPVPTRPDPSENLSARESDSELAAKLTRPPAPTPNPTRAQEVELAGRLCELHRELVGRPWTAPSQLLQALDGLGPLSRSPHPEHVRAISAHFEGPDSLAMVERAFRGFVADGWAKSKGYPMAAFAKDPQRYLAAPTKPASEVDDFSHASTTGEL